MNHRAVFQGQRGDVGVCRQASSGSGNGKIPLEIFQMALPRVERDYVLMAELLPDLLHCLRRRQWPVQCYGAAYQPDESR